MDEDHAPKNTALTQAVGAVALESSELDESLRGLLCNFFLQDEAMLLFEGQSTDWLTWALSAATEGANYGNRLWSAEQQAEFNEAVRRIGELRDLRNWVIHGTWSTESWEDQPAARLWGERDNSVKYYCRRSRQRRWEGERTFTVSDVQYLADQIRDSRLKIIRIYYKMQAERYPSLDNPID